MLAQAHEAVVAVDAQEGELLTGKAGRLGGEDGPVPVDGFVRVALAGGEVGGRGLVAAGAVAVAVARGLARDEALLEGRGGREEGAGEGEDACGEGRGKAVVGEVEEAVGGAGGGEGGGAGGEGGGGRGGGEEGGNVDEGEGGGGGLTCGVCGRAHPGWKGSFQFMRDSGGWVASIAFSRGDALRCVVLQLMEDCVPHISN